MLNSVDVNNLQEHPTNPKTNDEKECRLSKRLCYILRYGALKEGLEISEGGFVDVSQMMGLDMMKYHSLEDVLQEVETSISHRGAKRFESKMENDKTLIRACFCRNFELSTYHEGSNVPTLLANCLDHITSNINMYDLEDFPDEYLINKMIHRLKRQKKLNNSTLRQLLVPILEHLDLDGVYVTEGTIKLIWRSCPNLKVISLKDCGYVTTDNLMEQLLKNLPSLESINLCACKHLTDRTLKALCRYSKNLRQLNLSWIRTMSEKAIIDLMIKCTQLKHLDIYDHKISPEGRRCMVDIAKPQGLTVVLKGLNDQEVAPANPCLMLPNFGLTW